MIITEGIVISPRAKGIRGTGIYTQEQIDSWKPVTEAVHKEGTIIAQIWHVGRMSHHEIIGGQKRRLQSLQREMFHVFVSHSIHQKQ